MKVHIWGQMLVESFADGWRQVDFGLTVPDTVPFTNESLITARSKYHSQLELTHSSKIYVSANVVHLFFCLFNFPSTYGGKYLNTLEFLKISIINAYCMFSMNKKYFPYPKESTGKIH